MKIKNALNKHHGQIDIRMSEHIYASIMEDFYSGEIFVNYYCDIDPFCDEGFDYDLDIKLTGKETLSQVKKMVKDYMLRDEKVSDTKVVRSCWNEFNYDEYSMTLKSTKAFVKELKKCLKISNTFIYKDMGITGLSLCAMYLGY